MKKLMLIKISLTILTVLLSSCHETKKLNTNQTSKPSVKLNIKDNKYYDKNPFKGADNILQSALLKKSSLTKTDLLNPNSLWAISNLEIAGNFKKTYLRSISLSKGALPQILVPQIREEIKANPLLKALFIIPSNLKDIATFAAGIFVNDNKISSTIQKSLSEKIASAIGTSTQLHDSLNYRFDFFIDPISNLDNSYAKINNSFNIKDQSLKWYLIFSDNNLWSASEKDISEDLQIQLLNTAKSLLEWSYLFGLDKSSNNTYYGGLAFDPDKSPETPLSSYDPRKNIDIPAKIISGTYAVSYPKSSSIKMALDINEKWIRKIDSIDLEEQALSWASAALAFKRLKPSSRTTFTNNFFDPLKGLFPQDVHQISLLFLLGMSKILDGGFIDEKTHFIRQYAKVPASPNTQDIPADLKTLNALIIASDLWINQLGDNLNAEQLSAQNIQTMNNGRDKLFTVLRLSIQTIFNRFIKDSNQGYGTYKMVWKQNEDSPPPLSIIAETLYTLCKVEQTTLNTNWKATGQIQPDWQKKIVELFHWYVGNYISMLNNLSLRPEDIFWTYKALDVFKNYDQSISNAPWITDLLNAFKTAIENWDGEFK